MSRDTDNSKYIFHYFYRPIHASDDSAEMKSRTIRAKNVNEADKKWYSYDKGGGDLTRDLYEITDEEGNTLWSTNHGWKNK